MGRSRLLYLLILLCMALFYLVYPFWISWYLLIVTLIFPLFDLFVSLPGMIARRVSLFVPMVLDMGGQATLELATRCENCFSAGLIKTRLYVSNGENTVKHRLILSGESGSKMKMAIDTTQSGVTVLALTLLWVSSLMGLFSLPVPVKSGTRLLVLPHPLEPPKTAKLPRGGALRPKPGGGIAEEHDIRPYRHGDSIKSVHWKLSAKRDELIVREAMESTPLQRLVQCAIWNTAYERDLILGRLRWISDYLLAHDCPYYVRMGEDGNIAKIDDFDDLARFLLWSQDERSESNAGAHHAGVRFTWVFQVDAREDVL